MSGLVVIAIGAVLCFLGVASIHLEVLLTGFAIGWLLAEVFGGSVGVSLVVGLAGALVVWVLATFVFKVAMFFLGGIGGLVIGSKLAGLLDEGDRDRLLTVAVVLALAAVGAFAADRYRSRALLWLTSLGGAALIIDGLSRVSEDAFGFLRDPVEGWERFVAFGAWAALSLAGWTVQRRLFPKTLGLDTKDAERAGGDATWS
jgi:hypothetical protein